MSLNLTNYISGNMEVEIISSQYPGGYVLKTAQLVDPQFDPQIDQIDTITKHRVGYLDRQTILRVTLGLIATTDPNGNTSQSEQIEDINVLSQLHLALINPDSTSPTEGFFTMTIRDPVNFTGSFHFYSCVVTDSSPSNVVIEDVPVSTWNLFSLNAEYDRETEGSGSGVGGSGPRLIDS